ncbi:FkbM family methyltransferase [Rhizobium sp. NFR07]|uniref:FkbM family methyltransferase n=1 Tax=Rhizobium sp. NFR07 TaxID=1566262 RepID=UPI000B86FFB3
MTVNDIPFDFVISTPLAKNWYARKPNDYSPELAALAALDLRNATIFECGAHHGRDCVVLAKMVGPNGCVVSFEPHPDNVDVLKRNVKLNNLDNVVTVGAAVGASPGSLFIRSRSNAKVSRRGSGIEVPVVTVDGWAEQHGLWPDIMKIDVEGYEFEILRGAQKALARTPALSLEIHCNIVREFGWKPDDIWNLVDASKYDVFIQRIDGMAAEPLLRPEGLEGRPHLFFKPRVSRH